MAILEAFLSYALVFVVFALVVFAAVMIGIVAAKKGKDKPVSEEK